MYRKIVLAGGSGFLGSLLVEHFRHKAEEIIILSRRPRLSEGNFRFHAWDGRTQGGWISALESSDLLVNLCGKEVDCRYTTSNRAALVRSRLDPTNAIAEAIKICKNPPETWLNLSSATIYRHAEDRAQTENDGDEGTGFSVGLCEDWEAACMAADTPDTRKAVLRTSFVLGRTGGAFPKLRRLTCCGLGGFQGDGRQMVSWIHELDFVRAVEWIAANPQLDRAINLTGPNPVSNRAFMKALRTAIGVPFGLPSPKFLLRAGAYLLRTEPELILKSRWVIPEKLRHSGFIYSFPELEASLRDLSGTRL